MKSVFEILKTTALIIGAVIGAGFISGREIVSFFSNDNLILSCLICCLFFFTLFCALLYFGSIYGKSVTQSLYKKSSVSVNAITSVSLLIVSSAMLAGLDGLSYQLFGLNKNLPLFSVLAVALTHFICEKGVEKIKLLNLIISPVLIIVLVISILVKNGYSLEYYGKNVGFVSVVLYTGMNAFFAMPILTEIGENLTRKTRLISSAVSSIILSVLIFLISCSIRYEGANASTLDFPLLSVLNGGEFFNLFFSIIMVIGVFTTLVCTYYPVNNAFKSKLGDRGGFTLILLSFLLSRIGFKNIIDIFYPFFGVLGLIFVAVTFILHILNKKKKIAV